MRKLVIFDLDGVIVDSEPLMRYAFHQAYSETVLGGEPPIEEFFQHMGKSLSVIADHLGLPQSFCVAYREICERNVHRISLFPGIEDVLLAFEAQRTPMAILTGKEERRAKQILKHFQLDRFFFPVIASDLLRHAKPHPVGIQTILTAHRCNPIDAVMVGDAVSDIQCAQRAGITAVAVTWGIKPDHMLEWCEPDFVVHDPDDLFDLLSTIPATTRMAV